MAPWAKGRRFCNRRTNGGQIKVDCISTRDELAINYRFWCRSSFVLRPLPSFLSPFLQSYISIKYSESLNPCWDFALSFSFPLEWWLVDWRDNELLNLYSCSSWWLYFHDQVYFSWFDGNWVYSSGSTFFTWLEWSGVGWSSKRYIHHSAMDYLFFFFCKRSGTLWLIGSWLEYRIWGGLGNLGGGRRIVWILFSGRGKRDVLSNIIALRLIQGGEMVWLEACGVREGAMIGGSR